MKKIRRIAAFVMTMIMLLSTVPSLAESVLNLIPRENGPITLNVYSQLAN